MSNTNIKQNDQYNVDDAWQKIEPTNLKDFFKRFIKASYPGQEIEFHGASRGWECIRSTFDIRFEKNKNNIPVEQRMMKETILLETFAKEADKYFSSGERRLIEVANFKWKKYRNTGTAFVGRHYRLPTRCVDWTSDPLIALFFACRRDFDSPGVVWWMESENFSYAIASQWMPFYGKKENIEDDFERDFVNGNNKNILIRFRYPEWLERPTKQKAWIIMSGQYDVNHAEAIHRLGVRKCGRFIINPQMKPFIFNKLDQWGINGATLGIYDSCVEKIADEIAGRFFKIK